MYQSSTSPAMIFSIGIRHTRTRLLEGLCDIHLHRRHEGLTPDQLQEIITICNQRVLSTLPGTTELIDTLRAIADVIRPGSTVELDLNVQHYGTKTFGSDVTEATLYFCRHDKPWPENGFDYAPEEGVNTYMLRDFLFGDAPYSFTIGMINKKWGADVCDVIIPRDTIQQLDCWKMIELLEDELVQYGPEEVDIDTLMEYLQKITGGTVTREPLGDDEFGWGMGDKIGLLFIRGTGPTYRELEYTGNITALKEFLME